MTKINIFKTIIFTFLPVLILLIEFYQIKHFMGIEFLGTISLAMSLTTALTVTSLGSSSIALSYGNISHFSSRMDAVKPIYLCLFLSLIPLFLFLSTSNYIIAEIEPEKNILLFTYALIPIAFNISNVCGNLLDANKKPFIKYNIVIIVSITYLVIISILTLLNLKFSLYIYPLYILSLLLALIITCLHSLNNQVISTSKLTLVHPSIRKVFLFGVQSQLNMAPASIYDLIIKFSLGSSLLPNVIPVYDLSNRFLQQLNLLCVNFVQAKTFSLDDSQLKSLEEKISSLFFCVFIVVVQIIAIFIYVFFKLEKNWITVLSIYILSVGWFFNSVSSFSYFRNIISRKIANNTLSAYLTLGILSSLFLVQASSLLIVSFIWSTALSVGAAILILNPKRKIIDIKIFEVRFGLIFITFCFIFLFTMTILETLGYEIGKPLLILPVILTISVLYSLFTYSSDKGLLRQLVMNGEI